MAVTLRRLGHTPPDPAVVKAARRITASTRRLVWGRDRGLCRYCGRRAERWWTWGRGQYAQREFVSAANFDHVVPVHLGGGPDPDNLVLACRPCNDLKGPRTPQQAGMRLLPVCEAT